MMKLTSFLLTIAVSASLMFAIQKNITDCYIIKCNKYLMIFEKFHEISSSFVKFWQYYICIVLRLPHSADGFHYFFRDTII